MKRIGTIRNQELVWALAAVLLASLPALSQQPSPKPSTAPAPAASPVAAEPSPSTVVLKVGGDNVTKSDVDYVLGTLSPQAQKAVAQRGKRSFGDQYAVMMVLYQAAEGQHLDQSDTYQREMTQHRRQVMAQLEYQRLLSQMQVTQPEVGQYFSAHPEEFRQAKVRQVAIRVKSATAPASSPGLSLEQAQAKMTEIHGALANGMDPAKIAKQYNVPNQVKVYTSPQTIQDSAQLPPFVKAAFNLGIGQFTKPIETGGALVMLQVTGQSTMSLKDATPGIEQALRDQKISAQIASMKSQAKIWMDPGYFGPETMPSNAAQPGGAGGAPGGSKP